MGSPKESKLIELWKKRLSISQKGKVGFYKGKYGKDSPNWKGGKWNEKEYKNAMLKEWRHKKGVSKEYNSKIPKTKRECRLLYKYNRKKAGELTLKTIQLVYEDNIKKYGTLTCYLCMKPIEFKQDSLEHKIPLSRSGTNEYNNLAIAHRSCNSRKYNKTEKEYKKELKK